MWAVNYWTLDRRSNVYIVPENITIQEKENFEPDEEGNELSDDVLSDMVTEDITQFCEEIISKMDWFIGVEKWATAHSLYRDRYEMAYAVWYYEDYQIRVAVNYSYGYYVWVSIDVDWSFEGWHYDSVEEALQYKDIPKSALPVIEKMIDDRIKIATDILTQYCDYVSPGWVTRTITTHTANVWEDVLPSKETANA